MQHFTRQGQFEKAVKDAGFQLVATDMNAGRTLFAFEDGDLMGHFDPKMLGTLAEDKWESRNMECEIVHIRLFDFDHPSVEILN